MGDFEEGRVDGETLRKSDLTSLMFALTRGSFTGILVKGDLSLSCSRASGILIQISPTQLEQDRRNGGRPLESFLINGFPSR